MEIFSTSHDLVNLALVIGIIALSAAMVYFFITAAGSSGSVVRIQAAEGKT